jgi:hypothetical protein
VADRWRPLSTPLLLDGPLVWASRLQMNLTSLGVLLFTAGIACALARDGGDAASMANKGADKLSHRRRGLDSIVANRQANPFARCV